jgi:hypothetical protein
MGQENFTEENLDELRPFSDEPLLPPISEDDAHRLIRETSLENASIAAVEEMQKSGRLTRWLIISFQVLPKNQAILRRLSVAF